MAKPPGDPIPAFNLPSGVGLEIWQLLQSSAANQARFEEKLDQVRVEQERAHQANVAEQERAREQRGQMFDRFDEQREKIEKVDRRMDGVVRDVANIDHELTEEIKPELKTLREQRQHTAGAVWMLRTLWALCGAMVPGESRSTSSTSSYRASACRTEWPCDFLPESTGFLPVLRRLSH